MRIVIELKKDANPKVVLNQLFVHSPLQTTFGAIMLALVDQRPQVLDPAARCSTSTCSTARSCVRRRTEFDLAEAEKRAHILEGLKIALDHLDAVIALIRAAKDVETARTGLMTQFKLSEIQANAILEMRLARLTGLERKKIEEEYLEVIQLIEKLKSILASPKKILGIIRDEVARLKEKYGDARRTEIVAEEGDIQLRGHDRAEGHGDHDLARRLHQAAGDHLVPLAAPRRQGRDRRAHQGRGLHRAPVRRRHPQLPAVPHRPGPLLLAQGARGRAGRAHGARPAAGQPPRGPGARRAGAGGGVGQGVRRPALPGVRDQEGPDQEDRAARPTATRAAAASTRSCSRRATR